MASKLSNCKECGGQVGRSAKACPHCGAKVKKKMGVLSWLFIIFVILPVAWQIGTGTDDHDNNIANSTSRSSAETVAKVPKTEAEIVPKSQWRQRSYVDQMTDQSVYVVSLRSKNSVDFRFPYKMPGGSHLHLNFRENAGNIDAYLRIDKGQMLCGVSDCTFSLRVGDGVVQTWTGLRSSTHDNDMMFVRDARQLEEIVKRSDKIRIGIEFYQSGTNAFDFEVGDYPGIK